MTDEPFAIDTEDSLSSELSAKLSSGANTPRHVPSDGLDRYPKTRRSSSGRSTSPSPSRRSASASGTTTSGGSNSSAPTSRSHSPAMSRHASGDALHLHYIQAAPPKTQRSASQTRDASSAGEALPVLALGSHAKPSREDSNVTLKSPIVPASPAIFAGSPNPNATSFAGEVGSAFNSTSTAIAPTGAGPTAPPLTKRMTSFVEPPKAELLRDRSPSFTNRCKPSNHDVVALDPTAGAEDDGELEEVEEEDEEDASENEDEDEDGGDDNEDEDDEDENREDDDDDDDDEEDEDDEANQEQMRKSAISAGIEVVHWRKEEPEEE